MAATPFEPSPLLQPKEKNKEPTQRQPRSPVKSRGYPRHRTRSPTESVKESEMSLHKILKDFEDGKLNAFGERKREREREREREKDLFSLRPFSQLRCLAATG